MKISDFTSKAVKKEGKKSQLKICDGREFLKIVDEMLNGELYKLIRKLKP
jgi:hypothetical protein